MTIDFFDKYDIENDIDRIEKLIKTNIFQPNHSDSIFMRSAFIEVLICLRDLMRKTEESSSRICFTDDVILTPNVKDVSDLIRYVRDALCHMESQNHFVAKTKTKATFNIAYRKGNFMKIGDINLSSDYDDDVCFFFGEQRIYLKRHILRALTEAKQKLLPLL